MEINKKATASPPPFDYGALLECIRELTEKYPFVSFQYLGKSILGKAIPTLTFGSGHRSILYVGAHHGMEWLTSLLLMRYVKEFCLVYESGGRVGRTSPRTVFGTHSITVIPMLNPDGVDYQIHGTTPENPLYDRLCKMHPSMDFSHWQANARGVDLNHNYDAGFMEYKELERKNSIDGGCETRFAGEYPESEPEVAALCNLIRFQKNLRGIMTLHTQGEEIYYKSRNTALKGTSSIAKHLSVLTGYRVSEAEGLASYGGLTDWCVQKMNIPSFTIECGRGQNPLSVEDAPEIYATMRNAFFAFPTLL